MNGSDSLDGLTIAVQGLGKVGMDLARQLHAAGAKLIVANNSNRAAMKYAVEELGAANNVIYDDACGEALKARGILYAPDFIINAGQEAFTTYDKENVLKQVHNIYNTVCRMLEESRVTGKPEGVIACPACMIPSFWRPAQHRAIPQNSLSRRSGRNNILLIKSV